MTSGLGSCRKIRHIVRLRQMLRRWRSKAVSARVSSPGRVPADVPAGYVAVSVGAGCKRFVVRASHLNHPVFQKLLTQAEEEYGFTTEGPLWIPCDESVFEDVLRFLSRSDSPSSVGFVDLEEDFQRFCHVGIMANWLESRPLLHELTDKSIW